MTSVSLMLQTTMRVQQAITGLAIKGDQALSFMYPAQEQPEWAVFDEDQPTTGDTLAVNTERTMEAGGIGRFALYSTPIAAAEATAESAAPVAKASKPKPAKAKASKSKASAEPSKPAAEAAGKAQPRSEVAEYLNYDSLTLAQLRSRLRTLSAEELSELLEYERAGTARSPYLTMLENRITSAPGK